MNAAEAADSANVARFLDLRAAEDPQRIAVIAPLRLKRDGSFATEQISYTELQSQTTRLAHRMLAAGIRQGTRVLLMVRPGSDLIRCCFALFKVGAVPVVIDPGMGVRAFLRCVTRTRPTALVGIPLAHAIARVFFSAFRSVAVRIVVNRNFVATFADYPDDGYPVYPAKADDLAAILFTSGSTGAPKGVCYEHGQFDGQVRLVRDSFGIEAGEVDLPMLPVFALFNPALGMTTVVPLMNPGKPAKVRPQAILAAIRQHGVTNSFGSPVLWKKIARHARAHGEVFPGMRRILLAGAPVPPALFAALREVFPNAQLFSPYGATECLPVTAIEGAEVLAETAALTATGRGTCVGRAVAGVEIRIIAITDAAIASLRDVSVLPVLEVGEIIATGPTVTRSYDALPAATRKAKIDDDGRIWHRMGDAGYLDASGRLWFCGRIAERVEAAAGTYYTDPVEGVVNTLDGVGRCALIGLGKMPNQLAAMVIEPDGGRQPEVAAVIAAVAAHPHLPKIERVLFCKRFPVDVRHNAKIHRLELARRFS